MKLLQLLRKRRTRRHQGNHCASWNIEALEGRVLMSASVPSLGPAQPVNDGTAAIEASLVSGESHSVINDWHIENFSMPVKVTDDSGNESDIWTDGSETGIGGGVDVSPIPLPLPRPADGGCIKHGWLPQEFDDVRQETAEGVWLLGYPGGGSEASFSFKTTDNLESTIEDVNHDISGQGNGPEVGNPLDFEAGDFPPKSIDQLCG